MKAYRVTRKLHAKELKVTLKLAEYKLFQDLATSH